MFLVCQPFCIVDAVLGTHEYNSELVGIPQGEHWWSLERIQENGLNKTTCLSVRSGPLNDHPRTNFVRNGDAHAARILLKTSRRRSSWYKPHLLACPACGVTKVDAQRSPCIPSWVTHRVTTIAAPRTGQKRGP